MVDKILNIICEVYHKKYIGPLVVKHLHPVGYEVIIGMNQAERPIRIAAEFPEEEFLKFFREELRSRHLNDLEYFSGYKAYADQPFFDRPTDKKKFEI